MKPHGQEEACPVCGQDYDHYTRAEGNNTEYQIRSDATACRKTTRTATQDFEVVETTHIYVHL